MKSLLLAILLVGSLLSPGVSWASNAINDAIGEIDPPPGVDVQNQRAGGNEIGIVYFISSLIQIVTVVLGVWVVFNFIVAGYTLVGSGGDSGAFEKARENITQSVIGLILIVMAFTITGLISAIFFGDPTFLLSPRIRGPL